MIEGQKEKIRSAVRDRYRTIAVGEEGCCTPGAGSACCGSPTNSSLESASMALGYGTQELKSLPQGANLGLGCGNPQAIAALQPGETVVDLGSGGGIDCFLASRAVGPGGRVIGVDMTAEMVARAREAAARTGYENTEFRLGEIENLPVADGVVDVIVSNCVINLSTDKARVYQEAFRVLKPGGRLAISDMVASGPLPEEVKDDLALHSACVSGATTVVELESILARSGFEDVRIQPKAESRSFVKDWAPGMRIEEYVMSATVEACKPTRVPKSVWNG